MPMRPAITSAALLGSLLLVTACGTPGPVYRGAPPPGYSDREYAAKLSGEPAPRPIRNTSVDASRAATDGDTL